MAQALMIPHDMAPRPSAVLRNTFFTSYGKAQVVTPDELAAIDDWRQAFASHCKDRRYYEIVSQTVNPEFAYRYLVLHDQQDKVRVIQPFLLIRQDMAMGLRGPLRQAMDAIRAAFPRFATMRMLMVGCAAGAGHLGGTATEDEAWIAPALHAALDIYAKKIRVPVIVLKDFPAQYRQPLANFTQNGYVRIPSMPMTRLALPYASFEEYMTKVLSKATRKNLRRKFKKAAEAAPIAMEVVRDITPYVDEVYPLYVQVMERSPLHFERLTRDFLCQLGQEMPDRARFFIWRQSGKIIAFSVCMEHDNALHDDYLGMDYAVALDLHLYFLTLRDVLQWSMDRKLAYYHSTALNYDPKLHLHCELVPLDLYVKHTSILLNPFFRRLVRWLEPTRHDPVLRQFKNARDLWN